ncbi:MAG: cell division protein FtsQ/DivIB [Dermatophilaceae bacterium]
MRAATSHHAVERGLASSRARFARRAASRRRHPWWRVLGVATAASVVGGLVWLVGWSTLLAVDEVRVTGASKAAARSVVDRAGVVRGTPLVMVDTDVVAERVRGDITVAEVSVHRSWPGAVVVEVVHREPAIVVRNPRGQLEVVDVEGVAFGTVTAAPPGVPTVSAAAEAGMTPAALQAALTLLTTLPADLARQVTAVTVSSADLVTFRLGARTVVWGGGQESARKVAVLRALLPGRSAMIDVSAPDTPVTR